MAEVSIVIPYYNVDEKLTRRCIKSILNQTFKDIEIIIINDGSSEDKTSFIKTMARWDDRIIYYFQENKGVSSARNRGIALAKGKYIAFVDADDIVVPEYIEQAYNIAITYDADFVIGGSCLIDENGHKECKKRKSSYVLEEIEIYDKKRVEELSSYFISSNLLNFKDGYIGRGSVSRLVKLSKARKGLFPIQIPCGEDIIWNQRLFRICEKTVLVPKVWYFYYINKKSVTHRYNRECIKSAECQLNLLYHELSPCRRRVYYEFVNREFESLYGQIFSQYLGNKECKINFIKRIKIINQLRNREPWNLITKEYLKYASGKEKFIYYSYKSGTLLPLLFLYDRIKQYL